MSRTKELRKGLAFILKSPDAAENIFSALVHVDWLDMTHKSGAHCSPQRALVFTDDVSLFLGGSACTELTMFLLESDDSGLTEVPNSWPPQSTSEESDSSHSSRALHIGMR